MSYRWIIAWRLNTPSQRDWKTVTKLWRCSDATAQKQRLARSCLIGDSAGGANLAAALSLYARDRGMKVPQNRFYRIGDRHDHSERSPFRSVRENDGDYVLTLAVVDII